MISECHLSIIFLPAAWCRSSTNIKTTNDANLFLHLFIILALPVPRIMFFDNPMYFFSPLFLSFLLLLRS